MGCRKGKKRLGSFRGKLGYNIKVFGKCEWMQNSWSWDPAVGCWERRM